MPKEWKKKLLERQSREPAAPIANETANPETDIFAAEVGGAPEIDLHGLSVEDALRELDFFMHRELAHGTPVIKVIHGKGTYTLQGAVQKWFAAQTEFVPFFRGSHRPDEQGAVMYAALVNLK